MIQFFLKEYLTLKNKIISIILTLSLISSIIVAPTKAASTINNNSTENILYESQVYYTDITAESVFEDNNNCIPFEDVTIELPISKSSGSTSTYADYDIEVFVLRGGLKKSSNGTFTWYFNVDCPSSLIFKPDITVHLKLFSNFTDGILFNTVAANCTQVIDSNIDYSKDYTFTTTARTGYYLYKYYIVDESGTSTVNKTTTSVLYNRTGHKWTFEFSDVGKELPEPRADYIKGQLYNRDARLPGIYYTQYKQDTGITLDQSLYQVHHIQPLAYGGNNTYDNLIHLPIEIHTSVTGWFNGY